MNGYNTLQQYVNDYKLCLAAEQIDPGRDTRPTLTSFFKQRVKTRLAKSTKRFRNYLERNGLSDNDLHLIAVHQSMYRNRSFQDFAQMCYGRNVTQHHYRKILHSNAFKKGFLKKLYAHIPAKIDTKQELKSFINRSYEFSESEIRAIAGFVAPPGWKQWFEELIEEGHIARVRGRWR